MVNFIRYMQLFTMISYVLFIFDLWGKVNYE